MTLAVFVSIILIDSVLKIKIDEKYYPQEFLEECGFIAKQKNK